MSNEVRIQSSIQLISGNLSFTQGQIPAFQDDAIGAKGPTPGAVTATVQGTDVDFSQLTTPGWCRIINIDPTYSVTWGIWDPQTALFYPVGIIAPGKVAGPWKLAPDLRGEYVGTGTLAGPVTNTLRIKGINGPANVVVEAFEA